MCSVNVRCFQCDKEFLKQSRLFNEAIKRDWNQFCSPQCLKQSRLTGKYFTCDNPSCNKRFYRCLKEVNKTTRNFCSQTCSAIINNLERGLRNQKKCHNSSCHNMVLSYKRFCSNHCFQLMQRKKYLLQYKSKTARAIKIFVRQHGRIPFKRELNKYYRPARIAFGTWNNAIRTAGFRPNQLKFTRKYIANDKHICDSLAEKIIDDWLFSRKIPHEINVPYPFGNGFTVDFKINNYWIEFFGLSGQHQKYDKLKQSKLDLAHQHKLNLIAIYPEHLFPNCKLDQILGFLDNHDHQRHLPKILPGY